MISKSKTIFKILQIATSELSCNKITGNILEKARESGQKTDQQFPGAGDVYKETLGIVRSDDNVLYFDCGGHNCSICLNSVSVLKWVNITLYIFCIKNKKIYVKQTKSNIVIQRSKMLKSEITQKMMNIDILLVMLTHMTIYSQ